MNAKSYYFKFKLSLILSVLLLILVADKIPLSFDDNFEPVKLDGVQTSGFWNLTDTPIFIDDSDPNYNWGKTASENDWCSGSGTWMDPYIIENVTINGNSVGSCIEIKNSNKYFTIQNCTVYNSGNSFMYDAGLKLYNTSNGLLTNNNCSNHQRHGILLITDCINITIQSNIISDNPYSAIVLCEGSEFNKVINNKLINNGGTAIWLRSFKENIFSDNVQPCNSNMIKNNYFNNSNSAIFLQDGCSNNVISNNTIDLSNQYGIYLETVKGDDNFNNTISNNTISRSNNNAIEIYNCTYTKIFENIIIDSTNLGSSSIKQTRSNLSLIFSNQIKNGGKGVRFYGCYNNTISDNIIFKHSDEAISLSVSENNRISNNTIQETTLSGIGLYGSHNNVINENIITNNNYFGIYIAEGILSSNNNVFYDNFFLENNQHAVDNGINNRWNSTTIGNFWDDYIGLDANDDGIGDTPYYIPGVSGSKDNFPIWEDGESVFPTILRNSPLPPFRFGVSAPVFNLTIFDLHLHIAWYKVNDTYIHFFTPVNGINIISIDQDSWDAIPQGNLSIAFFVNDTNNNIVNITLTVSKDLPPEESPLTPGIPYGYYYFIFLGIGILALLIFQVKKGKHKIKINS